LKHRRLTARLHPSAAARPSDSLPWRLFNMKLSIAKKEGDLVRVNVSGKVTQHDFAAAQEPLWELLGPGLYSKHVTLDLGETLYVDSSGVGWLLTVHKRMREAGGRLTLDNTPSIVANLLRLLKLSKLFGIDPPGDEPEVGGLA
jgi:anti-sigma B factor antagonist